MSLEIAGANFLQPQAAWGAANAVLQRAESNETAGGNNTINLFIDGRAHFRYAASIVEACSDRTVYALQCTGAVSSVNANTCGPKGPIVTVTEGPSLYEFKASESSLYQKRLVTLTISESCSLKGTTAAACSGAATVEGTTASTTTTLSSSKYNRYDVQITGGAEKTASPTGVCKPNAASGFKIKGAAMFSLLGAVGVAAFLSV